MRGITGIPGLKAGEDVNIYMTCPDCKGLASLGHQRGDKPWQGHAIDAHGNISPSVAHSWKMEGVEQCGFHTQPTKLLGFMDRRIAPK